MVSVRPANPGDAEAAAALLRQSISELCSADHHGDAETVAQWLANKTPENFRTWLANAENFCVVAEVNESICGVGLLHRTGQIRLFYLMPGCQRQGIGKVLHQSLENQAQAWGLAQLNLESTLLARPFYESLGYRSAGGPRPGFGNSWSHPYAKRLQPDA